MSIASGSAPKTIVSRSAGARSGSFGADSPRALGVSTPVIRSTRLWCVAHGAPPRRRGRGRRAGGRSPSAPCSSVSPRRLPRRSVADRIGRTTISPSAVRTNVTRPGASIPGSSRNSLGSSPGRTRSPRRRASFLSNSYGSYVSICSVHTSASRLVVAGSSRGEFAVPRSHRIPRRQRDDPDTVGRAALDCVGNRLGELSVSDRGRASVGYGFVVTEIQPRRPRRRSWVANPRYRPRSAETYVSPRPTILSASRRRPSDTASSTLFDMPVKSQHAYLICA